MFLEILLCMFRSLWLPLALGATDRIEALRLYESALDPKQRYGTRAGSVLPRLRRAARRQQRINEDEIPLLSWIRQNKYRRSANYYWFIRRAAIVIAFAWGGASFAPYWVRLSPGTYGTAMSLTHSGLDRLAGAVRAITPPAP